MKRKQSRVAVIGAGIMGLSAAWSLTKAGAQVTLFERGQIPNPLSASGDQHRMIRRAYGGQDGYARLVSDAYDAWTEMWADIGAKHLVDTGFLVVSQYDGDSAHGYREGLERGGHPFEMLTARPASARWRFLDPERIDWVVHSEEGGVLLCERIAADLAAWLSANGCDVRANTTIDAVDPKMGILQVAGEGSHTFDTIVVTAGAWVLDLFPDLADRLTTYRTAVAYLAPPPAIRDEWSDAPAILDIGGTAEGYVLPPVIGTGLKVGIGGHKRVGRPDAQRDPIPGEGETLRDCFVVFADLRDYAVERVVTCAYAFTADERFWAHRRERAWIVSACSGHGYKFGAAVGRQIANAVHGGHENRLIEWLQA